jgi:catechol 2,3-dioxygenase-like lactoylglutathione lyase family enzyme
LTRLLAIDHVQLAIPVGAEAAARPLYRDLLGLTEVGKPEPGRSRGGSWYEAGIVKVHLGVEPDFRANRKAHPAFIVGDLRDLNRRAEAAGYEVKPDDELEGVERAFISDPFGNRLEFIQAANPQAPRTKDAQ